MYAENNSYSRVELDVNFRSIYELPSLHLKAKKT